MPQAESTTWPATAALIYCAGHALTAIARAIAAYLSRPPLPPTNGSKFVTRDMWGLHIDALNRRLDEIQKDIRELRNRP